MGVAGRPTSDRVHVNLLAPWRAHP